MLCDDADVSRYQQIIGSLYKITVSTLSQSSSKPTKHHTRTLELIYTKPTGDNQLILEGYSDSDYAGEINDRKSSTGNIF